MKKLFSLLLALTMLLCTACGGDTADGETPGGKDEAQKNIYTEITGVASDKTLMTVGEIEIPADLFFYWVNTVAKDAERIYQQYSMYYPQYLSLLNDDGSLNWKAAYSQNMTIGDAVCAQAMEKLAFFVVVEKMASANGVALTEEDNAEIQASIEKSLDQYAVTLAEKDEANANLPREEVEELYFYNLGVDRDDVARLMAVSYLNNALVEAMMTEGHALYVADDAYDDLAFYADHILIATVDLSTREALSPDEIAEKTALAEKILARLQASDDLEGLFASLADFHSEDTGRATNPTGYIFAPGTMVAEFENAVKELKPGELSGLVKSEFGYHIILRRDLAEGLKLYPDQKKGLAESYLTTLINNILLNSSVSTDAVLAELDLARVYAEYMVRSGQSAAAQSGVQTTDK